MFFLYTAQCAAISQFRDSSETESSPNAMWIVEHFTAILSHHASRSSDSFGFITFQFCPLKKIAIRCFSENRMRHLRFLQVWKNANWFCILVRVDRSEPRGPNFSVEHIPVNCCILGLVVGSGCVSVSTRTNFRTKRRTNPHTICFTYDFLYKTNRSQFKNGRNLIFRETIILGCIVTQGKRCEMVSIEISESTTCMAILTEDAVLLRKFAISSRFLHVANRVHCNKWISICGACT
jgi:hypothetical protein